MLYDPKWEKKQKKKLKDPFTLESLIAWLEAKVASNPNERYYYTDTKNCLLAQYFRAKGYKFISMGITQFTAFKWGFIPVSPRLPPHFNDIAAAEGEPIRYTMCAALARAQKVQRELERVT